MGLSKQTNLKPTSSGRLTLNCYVLHTNLSDHGVLFVFVVGFVVGFCGVFLFVCFCLFVGFF